MFKAGPNQTIFDGATATASSAEIDMGEANALMVFHHISGSTGGYHVLSHQHFSAEAAAERTATFSIATAARATNVVTLTKTAHGVKAGDWIVVHGVTGVAATFNGTFKVASAADANTLTYAQTGSNETATAATGHVHHIPVIACPTSSFGSTAGTQSTNQTTGYVSLYHPVSGIVRLDLTVGGGVHTVKIEGQRI